MGRKNATRNRLERDGLEFRKLTGQDSGEGFLLRVMDKDVEPPKVTTIVQQPGQDTVVIESSLFVRDRVDAPWQEGKSRFAPPEPTEPENPDRIIALLQSSNTYVARLALQQLLAAPEIIKQ